MSSRERSRSGSGGGGGGSRGGGSRSGGGGSRGGGGGGGGGGGQQSSSWSHDQAVELLNNAKLTNDAAAKAAHLKELQELILRKDPALLSVFLLPLLEMQVDPNNVVRKTIALMCEQIVAAHPEYTTPCVGAIRAFLKDAVPLVVKTAVKSGMSIFREALIETATRGEGPVVAPEIREMWAAAKAMKDDVRALVLAEVGTQPNVPRHVTEQDTHFKPSFIQSNGVL